MRWLTVVLLLLFGCSQSPHAQFTPMMSAYTAPSSAGDATAGHETFHKLRCNVCHSVAGEKPPAQIPLRDLSRETPDTVANLIVSRMETSPESMFDELAMSAAASSMTKQELMDIVAYLRQPSAAARVQR